MTSAVQIAAHIQDPAGRAQNPPARPLSARTRAQLARLPKSGAMTYWPRRAMPGPDFTPLFDKQVAEIPMRDGVTLHTEIYSPKNRAGSPAHHLRTHAVWIEPGRSRLLGAPAHVSRAHRGRLHLRAAGFARPRRSGGEFVTGGPMRDKSQSRSTDPRPMHSTASIGWSSTCRTTMAASARWASPTAASL